MSDRDELARDISLSLTGNPHPSQVSDDIAVCLIKKGYRKHRTVTTVEELDALPIGSVGLASKPWIKTGSDLYEDASIGLETAASLLISQRGKGVTVLHEGRP